MKQITLTLYDSTEMSLKLADVALTRSKDTNLVNSLTLRINEDKYIILKSFAGRVTIKLYKRSESKAFRNRLMQYDVKTLSYNNKTISSNDHVAELNTFSKLFTIQSDIQKALIKSNAILSNEQEEILLSKSAEIMIPSFMQQLDQNGYDYKSFTSQQLARLSTALVDFVSATGKLIKQKQVFDTFIQYLKNNNKKG